MCIYIYIYIYMDVCIYVCMYVCIYNIYMYTHIYTYTHPPTMTFMCPQVAQRDFIFSNNVSSTPLQEHVWHVCLTPALTRCFLLPP